jgi:hypothetical protein
VQRRQAAGGSGADHDHTGRRSVVLHAVLPLRHGVDSPIGLSTILLYFRRWRQLSHRAGRQVPTVERWSTSR